MCGPRNCYNMSSCERKCRPRDPFPTILPASTDGKILSWKIIQYWNCSLLLFIPHALVWVKLGRIDFGCWNLNWPNREFQSANGGVGRCRQILLQWFNKKSNKIIFLRRKENSNLEMEVKAAVSFLFRISGILKVKVAIIDIKCYHRHQMLS